MLQIAVKIPEKDIKEVTSYFANIVTIFDYVQNNFDNKGKNKRKNNA